MKKIAIGIDFAKEKFDVTVRNVETGVSEYGQYPNTPAGGRSMVKMVRKFAKGIDSSDWLFCGEDTGYYSQTIARYLTEKGYFVWLQNPYSIKHSEGDIRRGKDDKADSAAIAEYAHRYEDKARKWELPSKVSEELHLLLTRRDAYVRAKRVIQSGANEIPKRDKQGESVSLIKSSAKRLLREIDEEIDLLEAQMEKIVKELEDTKNTYEILRSFPGIGIVNSMCFIAYTDNFKKFDLNARRIATFWGVAPFGKDSGKTVHVAPHVSQFCNHWLKAILSNAANSAIVWNPVIKPYYDRLGKAGKCEGIRRNNVKNKIIQTITAMIRKGEKFDPEFVFTNKRETAEC
ncbi:MAG: transposase [Prevotella sp.]|nr:transposase [Prevotella sp.]